MGIHTHSMGGLVGTNAGTVESCYSRLEVSGRQAGFSGLCGSNAGVIRQSFHTGGVRGLDAGLCAEGERQNCYFFTRADEAERARRLRDGELWREDSSVRSERDARALGFDEVTWGHTADRNVLAFNEDTWLCDLEPLPALPAAGPLGGRAREEIAVGSASDLEDLARRVNAGDAAARTAHVTLTADIDLAGRAWTPIGCDLAHSFRGALDGRGHAIKNFRVSAKGLGYRGLFGVVEDSLCNLTVDCAVAGDGVVGTLAGQLLGGSVRCCGAVASLRPGNGAEAVGGLVGINCGTIERSYAAGRASFAPPLLAPYPLAVLALLLASLVVVAMIVSHPPRRPVNNVVEPDDNQLAIPAADLPDLVAAPAGERHSVSFSTSTEATADLATGEVDIDYKSTNPDADQKVVVQLRLSTGVVIAETGAIMPGHEISGMRLTDRAMAELEPGRYSAFVYMVPYSVEDESRGFTEIDVPVTLTVV